jgi:hypothetical protein
MPSQTLLFITDISGFTKFVAGTQIDESYRIAKEMIELIIDSNQLGMQVSEIEGDAVFFYTQDNMPSLSDLMNQIYVTNAKFRKFLKVNELETGMGLKFFVHRGACQLMNIRGHRKLFGLDVIKIHRLLKNNIAHRDYILITNAVLQSLEMEERRIVNFYSKSEFLHYDSIGPMQVSIMNHNMLSSMQFSIKTDFSPLHDNQFLSSWIRFLQDLPGKTLLAKGA